MAATPASVLAAEDTETTVPDSVSAADPGVETAGSADQAPEAGAFVAARKVKTATTFSWPRSEATKINNQFKRLRRDYRHATASGPYARYELTKSHLLATALERAFTHPQDWATPDNVRNDSRRLRAGAGEVLDPVGLIWSLSLLERLTDMWEALDIDVPWPPRFTLTKANLALAGILHELETVTDWLAEVPNDDRFTEVAADDGRRTRYANRPTD